MYNASRGTLNDLDSAPTQVGANSLPSRRDPWRREDRRAGGGVLPVVPLALHLYTVFVAFSILVLICSGGLVTSNNAGLAVPDWPNSYGYNMFAFPISRWVGGVWLEHTHRLAASAVGVFTLVLAASLAWKEPRRWVRTLGYVAVALVIAQGVLGGLRVVYRADWIGVFHGCTAQAFLALVSFIALATSRWWIRLGEADTRRVDPANLTSVAKVLLTAAVLIYLQLALGAAMRHAHAGLSIPDFPKAYGHWWPQVHRVDLPALNQQRTEVLHEPATTLAQIHLQMTHRMNATLVLVCILAAGWSARRQRASLPNAVRRLITAGIVLVAAQITLGIYTIWTNKAADVATAHVAVGATLFVWSVLSLSAVLRWRNGRVQSASAAVKEFDPAKLEAVA